MNKLFVSKTLLLHLSFYLQSYLLFFFLFYVQNYQNNEGYLYLVNFNIKIEPMQKYIENKMNEEVKHIINLQFLLNQYDRENKHLNKQILDLLSENKQLKISKIKNKIFNRETSRIFQKIEPRKSSKRKSEINIKQDDKDKYYQALTTNKQIIKDKILQETSQKTNSKSQIVVVKDSDKVQKQNNISKIPYLVEKDIQTFSFRGNSNLESPRQILHQSTNQFDVKQTNKKHSNQDIKQQSNLFKKTDIQNSNYLSPNSKLNSSFQTIELKTETKNDQSYKSSKKKIDNQHYPNQKYNRSHHAINPSPQITPCQSQKNLMKRTNVSCSNLANRGQSIQNHQYDSIQKRKKFISMISLKITPLRMKTEGCC